MAGAHYFSEKTVAMKIAVASQGAVRGLEDAFQQTLEDILKKKKVTAAKKKAMQPALNRVCLLARINVSPHSSPGPTHGVPARQNQLIHQWPRLERGHGERWCGLVVSAHFSLPCDRVRAQRQDAPRDTALHAGQGQRKAHRGLRSEILVIYSELGAGDATAQAAARCDRRTGPEAHQHAERGRGFSITCDTIPFHSA